VSYIDELDGVAKRDVAEVKQKDAAYGGSWKKRGGIGAFMMMCRKWDRLEQSVLPFNYDIFKAIEEDKREESVLDDIRDLRRYLMLIESEIHDRASKKARERAVDNFRPNISNWPIPNTTLTTPPAPWLKDCPCGDQGRPNHPDGWCCGETVGDA
jgi:hypothetical protein